MKRDCPICGSNQKRHIFNQRFVSPSSGENGEGYQVVICDNCDFAYADEIQSQETLDAYYAGNTPTATALAQSNLATEFTEQKHHIDQHNNSLFQIIPFLFQNDRIIDIGCGTGHLLSLIVGKGFKQVCGLDPSPIACEIARESYGLTIFEGSLLDSLEIGKFDFVILSHILEHIENLNLFLLKLKSILNPNGRVYIEVPDAYNFSLSADPEKELCSAHANDIFVQFTPEHINFFSTLSLENLMRANGFGNISMEPNISTMGVISSVWIRAPFHKDIWIDQRLKEYVNMSEKVLDEIAPIIKRILTEDTPIYIWGAGLHTQRLLANTELSNLNIHAFIDSNAKYHGATLHGVRIISPEKLLNSSPYPILISSKKAQKEIENQILSMGLKNRVIRLYQQK